MLVHSVVVQVMTVAAAGSLVVSLVSGAANGATSVDGVAINLVVVSFLRLLNESGEGSRSLIATVVVSILRVSMVILSGACNCCEAGKGERLEHFGFLGKCSKSRYLRPKISPFDSQRGYLSCLMPPLFPN